MSFLYFSCKKKTNDPPTPTPTYQNGFHVYNTFRETNNAVFYNDNGTVGFAFTSSSLHLDTIEGVWHGIGDGLNIEEIFTNTKTGIPTGNFVLNSSGAVGTFNDAMMILDYDFDADTGMDSYAISGTITISQVNDNYLLQYNLVMYDSATITGTYYGNPIDISSMLGGKNAALLPRGITLRDDWRCRLF
jgi:hypothetical protein